MATRLTRSAALLAAGLLLGALIVHAGDAAPGVVSHIKVLSDKVEDVSSLEAWKKSFIKDGMTDEQKAMTIWENVYRFRHQDNPPNEFLHDEGNVHDPIKTFNVYGYGMCCCAASNVAALARYVGLQARGRIITAHSVPEVFWDGKWRLLDASLIAYFPGPDGKLLGVDELIAGLDDWYQKNPGYKGNDKKLGDFMRGGGWRKGPEVFSKCPTYDDNGWFPAATHGWYSTMGEYVCKPNVIYEYGYSQGYEVNVQLRPGERLTRNWSNKGLQANMLENNGPGCIKGVPGQNDMRYTPKHGDVAPGRIGNGTHEYDVPLAGGAYRTGALLVENIEDSATGPRVKDAAQPGTLIIRMPSSYVYLSGEAALKAVVAAGGEIAVSFSDNNGLDWKDVTKITASGESKLDLKPLAYRRYDYRLRFVMKGKGTGLDALKITHDIQHSQRPLPALAQGANTITFSAGLQEGTITMEGTTNPANKAKNVFVTDYHPQLNGVQAQMLRLEGGKGDVTFSIATPAEMTRLRFGGFYRARDAKDGWDYQVSFDGGKTFKTVDRAAGPCQGCCKYVVVSDVPAGTKAAQVRFVGEQRNTLCLFDFRIDADYKEPNGGFRPVKITYVWDEGGTEKKDVHVAQKPEETYTINCAAKPTMKSLIVELAQ
ncbi:MAG: hypothetical protein NTW87_28010 [Planctomycetota bacterium]|nr:hypothetical protein [Planctomycetota bacterium]